MRPDAATPSLVRIPRWVPAAVLCSYALSILLFCVERAWRPEWDSALYLLTARSMAEGHGYIYLGEPFLLRPPGLSWFLSLFYGDAGFDHGLLNGLMVFSAALAVGAVYLLLRGRLGRAAALAAALLMGTSAVFVGQLNWILSDMPFVALYLPAMFLFERALAEGTARRRAQLTAGLGGSLLLVAAIYLRTPGALLLPGVVLASFLTGRGRSRGLGLIPVLLVLACLAPWIRHTMLSGDGAPRATEQLLLADYTTALLRVDPGDPASRLLSFGEGWQRVRENGVGVATDLSFAILGSRSPWSVAVVLVVLMLGCVAALARGPTLLDWHGLAYGALLLIYFTYDTRLLLPLLPAAFAYLLCAVDWIRERLVSRGRPILAVGIAAVALTSLLVANLAALPRNLDARREPLGGGTRGDLWDDHARAAAWLREHAAPEATIMTDLAPVLSYLSERRVYTNRFPRADDLIGRYEVDYVIVFPWGGSPQFQRNAEARATGRTPLPSHVEGRSIRILDVRQSP